MTVDLSRYHEPLTYLFPNLSDQEQLTQFQLTSEQLEFYYQNGYIAGVHLLERHGEEWIITHGLGGYQY